MTLAALAVGDKVNLEVDLMARYAARLLERPTGAEPSEFASADSRRAAMPGGRAMTKCGRRLPAAAEARCVGKVNDRASKQRSCTVKRDAHALHRRWPRPACAVVCQGRLCVAPDARRLIPTLSRRWATWTTRTCAPPAFCRLSVRSAGNGEHRCWRQRLRIGRRVVGPAIVVVLVWSAGIALAGGFATACCELNFCFFTVSAACPYPRRTRGSKWC